MEVDQLEEISVDGNPSVLRILKASTPRKPSKSVNQKNMAVPKNCSGKECLNLTRDSVISDRMRGEWENCARNLKQKKRALNTPSGSPVDQLDKKIDKKDVETREVDVKVWNWCKRVLEEFWKMPEALKFLEPVDWVKLKLPLWPNIIKNPMDLKTIKQNLDLNHYVDIFEFDRDMKLVWSNAKTFYRPDSNIFKAADFLSEAWRRRFASIKNNPAVKMLWGEKTQRSRKKKSPRKRKRHRKSKQVLDCGDLKATNTLTATIWSPGNKVKHLPTQIPVNHSGGVVEVRNRHSLGEQSSMKKLRASSGVDLSLAESRKNKGKTSLRLFSLGKMFSRFVSQRGIVNEEGILALSMSQLGNLETN